MNMIDRVRASAATKSRRFRQCRNLRILAQQQKDIADVPDHSHQRDRQNNGDDNALPRCNACRGLVARPFRLRGENPGDGYDAHHNHHQFERH